jgi:hypothetical protein
MGLTSDLQVDYSDYDNLSKCALISYNSAIKHILDADQVMMVHRPVKNKSIQNIERRIIQIALDLHSQNHNVLLLEADAICVNDFKFADFRSDYLQLFALAGGSDYREKIPNAYYFNSGVIYFPRDTNFKVTKYIENQLNVEWPSKWAYYQLIWNSAYYIQFDSFDQGRNHSDSYINGKYNWLAFGRGSKIQVREIKIVHLFTSRGIRSARKIAEKMYFSKVNSKKREKLIRALSKPTKPNIMRRVLQKLLRPLQ